MKSYFLILVGLLILACKTRQSTTVSATQEPDNGKTIGKVSHQYKTTGCETVVIVEGNEKPLILIPREKLADELDMDGLRISFDYRLLKMPNPPGCNTGISAELKNIAEIKK